MEGKINSWCSICGRGYHVCNSCRGRAEAWRNHTDTSEHYKVYQILHGYSTGVYGPDEARKRLEAVDLSDLETFREHIRALVEKLLAGGSGSGGASRKGKAAAGGRGRPPRKKV